MSLILHHALKDLRAQRWLVAAWATALAATCVVEAFKLDVAFTEPVLPLSLTLARVVFAWLLAIRFVHSDPVDGSDAFWLTRPLSARDLLAAKGGLIGGLLLVPGAVAAFVLVMNGVAWTTLPFAVGQWMLIDAEFLLPIALLAAMTRDVARMVLAISLAIVSRVALQSYTLYSHIASVELSAHDARRPVEDEVGLASLVIGVAVVALTLLLVRSQYLTRRTPRTLISSLAGLAAAIAVTLAWPVRAALDRTPGPVVEWKDSSKVSVTVRPGSVRSRVSSYYRIAGVLDTYHQVVGDLQVAGLDEALLVHVLRGRATLRVPGERALDSRDVYAYGYGFLAGDLTDPSSRQHFEQAIAARLADRQPRYEPRLQLLGIPGATAYARYQAKSGALEANLKLEALRITSVSATPLRPGASISVNGSETTIISLRRRSSVFEIEYRRAAPRTWPPRPNDRVEFVARNRRRHEAVILWHGLFRPNLGTSFVFSTVGRAGLYLPQSTVSIDAAWLADAELVLVSLEPLGRFDRAVNIPDFTLPETR